MLHQSVTEIAADSDSDNDETVCADVTDTEQDFEGMHDDVFEDQVMEVDGSGLFEDMWFDEDIVDSVTYLDL